jgi:cobalamin biosynthesis Mg chelatase CobN
MHVLLVLQAGNVFIGVQPLLGVEGDPMRLLFERDLTPHPQYAAFYKWLQNECQADVVLHFGMHGTVEWLPGGGHVVQCKGYCCLCCTVEHLRRMHISVWTVC